MDRASSIRESSKLAPRVWLDCLDYGCRLFAPGVDIWGRADNHISVVGQVQKLLRSDVIQVRVDNFYRTLALTDPELIASIMDGRPSSTLRMCLRSSTGDEVTQRVLAGLSALFPNLPLVIVIDGAAKWLRWAATLAGSEGDSGVTVELVDRASVHLADLLRRLSDTAVSGMVIDLGSPVSDTLSEELGLNRPLLNVAKHYKWETGVLIDNDPSDLGEFAVDLVLGDGTEFAPHNLDGGAPVISNTLMRSFWIDDTSPSLPNRGLFYGKVPEDSAPERVLARLAGLRAAN